VESIQKYGFTIERSKLIYFGLWLIIPFCSFTSHTIVLVPPTLILFFIGAIVLIGLHPRIHISTVYSIPMVCASYYLLSQMSIGAPAGRYIGVVAAILYFIITVAFGFNLDDKSRDRLISKFINYSTMLLIAECAWRLTHPRAEYAVFDGGDDSRWIYQYKFGGLMYTDSNAVGIHIIILLFFIYYLEKEQKALWPKIKIVLLILLVLTFSRAAWFGFIVGWVYMRYLQNKRVGFYIFNLFLFISAGLLFYRFYLQAKISSDLSYQSKFDIIGIVLNHFKDISSSELFLGIGFSNSLERMGVYAHNFFMVFLIESGIIGLSLMILLLVQFTISTKLKALYVLVPFLITTLSSTITFMPFFYVVIALIFVFENKRTESTIHEN
jgi:hypothetical protein